MLLRSIAYQIARCIPAFLQKFLQLTDEAIDFETADSRTIWERIFKAIVFNMQGSQPLYWIIDGLDEADDPRALVKLFSDVTMSSVPIHILLTSRKTSEITTIFHKVPQKLDLRMICVEGHQEDLRYYIGHELSMSGTPSFVESVVERVIELAQNNFLVSGMRVYLCSQAALIDQWVRYAVDKLNLCHTQADVERSLQDLPVGMEELYDRMASIIAGHSSTTDKAFASTVLQFVSCSLHTLTVAELSQALHDDTSKLLDVQRSIVDLCGGFVVIDNGGHVALIHQTAREYLFSTEDRPFHIDRDDANKQIFLSCMGCLMTSNLRTKVKGGQEPEFLVYAATSWSSHLKLASVHDGLVVEALQKFLTGSWVLTWIQILAASGHLRVLVQASKQLLSFSARLSAIEAAQDETDYQSLRQEQMDSWAEDFIKIVGKFGTILVRNPESIYKLIAPFCPANSAIYQQFGKVKDRSLVVSGLLSQNWDDSLARMSFGSGSYATWILAAGAQIAIMISSGSVVLYDAATFEVSAVSPLRHGERIYRMELNSAGTLLATYGYLTTKVWEISTGICILSAKNVDSRPRPLAMLLADNSTTLIVGMDDRRIRSLDLKHKSPSWQLVAILEEPELEGHFLNSANHMALSRDGSLIAVAYRGHPLSAWETDGPVHIGHCWRKREEIARGEVIEAVWHPHCPEVLGLYIEGIIFKWRPYENEIEEIAAGASRLAISRDGNLFSTGDVRGTVKVYTTSEFGLLYQLTSEDTVLGLAFSPDLHRFYDIRGNYGNAWEPNSLVRYAEQRGKDIESGSETRSFAQNSTASENSSARVDSITALAGSPTGRLYCCGTEDGRVHLHDMQRGKLADLHVSKSFLSIEQMSWSNDGRYICFSDSSKKVIILSLNPSASDPDRLTRTELEMPMTDYLDGPILQLLFHHDSSLLLVYSSAKVCVVSLKSQSSIKSLELNTAECKWIVHPLDLSLILGIGSQAIHIIDWSLAQHSTCKIVLPGAQNELTSPRFPTDQRVVDRVLVTQDKKHIMVQVSPSNHNSKGKHFLYFDTSHSSLSSQKDDRTTIALSALPLQVSSQISIALSILSGDKLIFLSKTFSICSWRLSFYSAPSISSRHTAEAETKPLFWLPGDWISQDCLALCCIWNKERSLLCPRNGEVAVVRCTALV